MRTSRSVFSVDAGTRRSGRGTRASIASVGLLVTLSACAKQDLKSEMSRVRAWTATTKLASELRGVRSTNRAVTHQLLQRAVETHETEARELARLAQTDSQRVAARILLDSLRQGITRLRQEAR